MNLRNVEWPTLLLLVLTHLVWGIGTLVWGHWALLSILLTAVAITQHASLQHEALHGHPFRNARLNEALVFAPLGLFIPYRRFRDTHLQHHFDPNLTDPYDDPESHYQDPAQWARIGTVKRALWVANNTLAGRMVLGPILGNFCSVRSDFQAMVRGDVSIRQAWALHVAGLVLVAAWLYVAPMPVWAYLLAVWLGMALLKVRSFLEHRAHEACRARTVVIEDRGPLALLYLNNNFHVVHHMHPQVPWYELPGLYAERKAHYLRRNDGYVYRSYAEVFRRYFLRVKDPVPHPVWPVRKAPLPDDC